MDFTVSPRIEDFRNRIARFVDERVLPLDQNAAVVAYTAYARRADMDYRALVNSTYRRTEGGWRLALHQQTPF